MSGLAAAVLGVQTDAPDLHFDAANPHFKNKFLSLHGLTEALRPVLVKHGLVVLQFPTQVDGQPALRTKLVHAESGESEEDTMLLAAAKLDPQGQGSAITYARRYSLMAILGLVADEDDDANAASTRSAVGEPTARGDGDGRTRVTAAPTGGQPSPSAVPTDAADVVIGFGKNKDKRLGDLSPKQLEWYANVWEPNPQYESDEDRALKTAAQQLVAA